MLRHGRFPDRSDVVDDRICVGVFLKRKKSAHIQQEGVGGVMVSIVAFQAVDPGSIPGQRSLPFF